MGRARHPATPGVEAHRGAFQRQARPRLRAQAWEEAALVGAREESNRSRATTKVHRLEEDVCIGNFGGPAQNIWP